MSIGTPLVTAGDAAELRKLSEGSLRFPADTAKPLAAVDATPCNARGDTASGGTAAQRSMGREKRPPSPADAGPVTVLMLNTIMVRLFINF